MRNISIQIYSVLNLAFGGGFERWVSEVAPRLAQRGHRIHVVTTLAGDKRNLAIRSMLIKKGITITELDNYNTPLTVPKFKYSGVLLNIAKSCDVIYFNNAFAGNEILMKCVKSMTNIKVVAAYHGIFPTVGSWLRRIYYRTINKAISKSFDAHHVVNRERKRLLTSYGYRNVYYIPNGVDIFKFKPARKDERFTVIFVGRLNYQKGFDLFAEAIKYLNRKHNGDLNFVIVGNGPLAYLAKSLQNNYSNVEWFSFLSDEELIRIYQRGSLLVAPSRFEEFLLTSIEAQACGTPVVVSDIPGPRDNVIDGYTGLLIKPSIDELINGILFFKDLWQKSRDLYEEYSHNARRNALNYDWNIIVKKLERMLVEVLGL